MAAAALHTSESFDILEKLVVCRPARYREHQLERLLDVEHILAECGRVLEQLLLVRFMVGANLQQQRDVSTWQGFFVVVAVALAAQRATNRCSQHTRGSCV